MMPSASPTQPEPASGPPAPFLPALPAVPPSPVIHPELTGLRAGLAAMVIDGSERDWTARQMLVLLAAARTGRITIRALADELGISKPAISRAVDVLEANGFVRRHRDPADARSVLVLPGGAGLHFLSKLRRAVRIDANAAA